METVEIRCVVRGKVQGVFYRDFVVKHAQHLGINGYVRNTVDSTVEVVAQGPQDKLENFVGRLRRGSLRARVSEVDVEWRKPKEKYRSFDVVF